MVRGQKNPLHFELPKRLKRARKAAGLSRRALAARAGISDGVIRHCEDGGGTPGVDIVEKLAAALGCSPAWLAFGEDMPPGPSGHGELALRLRESREAAGLSRRALGLASGTSDTSVRQAEEGDYLPSLATVEKLAAALGVSAGWLGYGSVRGELVPERGLSALASK